MEVTKVKMNGIRYLRIKHDLTQEELAKKIGITRQYISEVEIGKRSVSDKIALKLADVFGVSVSEVRGENIV